MSTHDRPPAGVVHTLQPGDQVDLAMGTVEQTRSVREVPHSTRWRCPMGEDWQTTRIVLEGEHHRTKPILVEACNQDFARAYTYDDGEPTTDRGEVTTLELVDVDPVDTTGKEIVDIDGITLPVDLTEQQVRESARSHVTVAQVASDLGLTVGQTRAVLFHLDEYTAVTEARYDKRTTGEEGAA